MSTGRLFTSCFYVSAAAFDLLCRGALALCQNTNRGSVLCPSAGSGSSKTSAWLPLADLSRSTGQWWLAGSKHISKVKIWSRDQNVDKTNADPAGLFFYEGGGQGRQMTVQLWNEGWVSQKAGNLYEVVAVLHTWLGSPKHIGNL